MYEEYYGKQISKLERQVEALFKINKNLKKELDTEKRKRKELADKNQELRKDLTKANKTIEDLTLRLKKNSKNSSKPSSTDSIYTKEVHNFREKTGRKVGGQKGHKGHTIEKLREPTKVHDKKVEKCECGGKVKNEQSYKSKQILDIRIEVDIIEERVYKGKCEKCGKQHEGEFSESFKNPVQYGNNIKALATVLIDEGYVSLKRCANMIKELTRGQIKLSEGTIVNFKKEIVNKSEATIKEIRKNLIESEVMHLDETGVRITGGLGWLHTATTNKFTMYQVQKRRKPEEINENRILPFFVGTLVHDHFKAYYSYKTMKHSECNVHILRYLKGVVENFKRKGAEKLMEFLVNLNNEKKIAQKYGFSSFSAKYIEDKEKQYIEILDGWEKEFKEYKKGKEMNTGLIEEKNLFSRLREYQKEHLLFIKDFKVPFDNNMAERSLRMIKTKMKVSGCFRGVDKGNNFATIRSIIESVKKHKMNVYDSILKILNNNTLEFVET